MLITTVSTIAAVVATADTTVTTGVSDGEAPGSVWAVVFLSFMFDMLLAANLVLQWVAYNDFIKVSTE
jgi:hypothetical protein